MRWSLVRRRKILLRAIVCLVGMTAWNPPEMVGQETATKGIRSTLRVVKSEFVFEKAPHAQCHASTIVETKDGLACAWFGGVKEGDDSVGIWFSSHRSGVWSPPVELANGVQKKSRLDRKRFPCWNPVLFQMPSGPLLLFYKVGPNPREWWGMLIKSDDSGRTWSTPERLPDPIAGPIKNKPVLLSTGTLLCGSSTEHDGWKVHMEMVTDISDSKTWSITDNVANGVASGAIQPAILTHPDGRLQILCRNKSKDFILSSFSKDGKSWSTFEKINLPNPNSGIDAATLNDGRQLVVYNHTKRGRSPINVAISSDGKDWKSVLELENEPRQEFSYPAVIQTADGKIHVTYTWKRVKVKHVVIDTEK